MNKQEAFRIVLEELKKIPLLCGIYDARNGNEHFMYGVSTVMEIIAHNAVDEEFEDMFIKNMVNSEDKEIANERSE